MTLEGIHQHPALRLTQSLDSQHDGWQTTPMDGPTRPKPDAEVCWTESPPKQALYEECEGREGDFEDLCPTEVCAVNLIK